MAGQRLDLLEAAIVDIAAFFGGVAIDLLREVL